jgi:glycosyltransferase involved in cell wall biosynthesis
MFLRGRRPLVSVCIPTYNGLPYLEECLASIRAQTVSDIEILIIDDASSDGTPGFVERLKRREPRLRFYRNRRNLGLVGNWNRCAARARGRWVKFVFQDDTLEPECLQRLIEVSRPGVPMTACVRALRFEDGVSPDVKRMYRRHLAEHNLSRRFPGRTWIPARAFAGLMVRHPVHNCVGEPTAVLFRRSVFRRYGLFNADMVNICDWEYMARVAVNGGLCFTPQTLATFRVHPRSASAVNRSRRLFRAEVLDEVILRHELAHAPGFAPVRKAAAASLPRVDLGESLAIAAQRAAAKALFLRRDADAREGWRDAVRRYPRIAQAPPARDGAEPLEVARDLWAER